MPYRLNHHTGVNDEVARIVEEQIDRTIGEIDDQGLGRDEAVHQVRKRCKKIRAVLRLARGPLEQDDVYAAENARYRDIGRALSGLRDAEVLVETHDAIMRDRADPGLEADSAAVRHALLARHDRLVETEAALAGQLQTARARLLEGRTRVRDWSRRVRGFAGLAQGLEQTYRRGRRAMRAAYRNPTDPGFHDWRKRVKYHWHACRLLRQIWPAEMQTRGDDAGRLADLLGEEHDLGVYRDALTREPTGAANPSMQSRILAAADERRAGLRRKAHTLGLRLYAEKPAQLRSRFAAYWDAWRTEDG